MLAVSRSLLWKGNNARIEEVFKHLSMQRLIHFQQYASKIFSKCFVWLPHNHLILPLKDFSKIRQEDKICSKVVRFHLH